MTDKKRFAGMFQDAAGTIPVTKVGDPVRLSLDTSGNEDHLYPTGVFYGTDGKRCFLTNDPRETGKQEQET